MICPLFGCHLNINGRLLGHASSTTKNNKTQQKIELKNLKLDIVFIVTKFISKTAKLVI